MKRLILRYIAIVVTVLSGVACSVTRDFANDEYLLSDVRIEADETVPRKERVTIEKERYVRQLPNKKILGVYTNVWIYQNANKTKSERLRNFALKKGEAPVLYDEALTARSVRNLQTYLHTRGYFQSSVSCRVDTSILRRNRVRVTYIVEQGPATRIDSISYDFRDKAMSLPILADTASSLLKVGAILDESVLEQERNRIATMLNNHGYYDFTANSINYRVDTLGRRLQASVNVVVEPILEGYSEDNTPIWEDHAIYRLRDVNVYPTYDPMLRSTGGFAADAHIDTTAFSGLNIIRDVNSPSQLRSVVLRRNILLSPSQIYNASEVMFTQKELMSLGFFRSSRISFEPVAGEMQLVPYGEDSLRVKYLDCNIYAIPNLRQNIKVDIEASTTSTFQGVSLALGYSNRNVFRGAEAFDLSTRFGFEFMRARDVKTRIAKEFGVTAGLSYPRFLVPVSITPGINIARPRTRFELAFDYQNRPYYSRNIFTARIAYSWQQGARSSWVLRPVDVNWINVHSIDETFLKDMDNQYLKTSFESQINAGMSLSWIYNTQRSDFDQNVTIIRANIESVGNMLQGLSSMVSGKLLEGEYHTLLGVRYAQYVRGEMSISHKINVGERSAIATRFFSGIGVTYGNSKGRSIPFDRMFYCGGANSMRGWVLRTLGPGNKPMVSDVTYPSQVGDMRLEANVEYRFPMWSVFNGAVFFDAGNVWYIHDTEDSRPEEVFHIGSFYRQLGLNTGFGLRIDIMSVILRIDFGVQLHNPGKPEGSRWIKTFHWDNTAFNFAVGYPF